MEVGVHLVVIEVGKTVVVVAAAVAVPLVVPIIAVVVVVKVVVVVMSAVLWAKQTQSWATPDRPSRQSGPFFLL
ncbi:hypothetical protein ElyMa_000024400 [Elysia marginata]|uniref:Uncharacterized protein n=1 Tax=Elysia marginata TaxID=1093978 RepID=A0AAV4EB69_9GAST|nr:hypothetical protein ElyMa_000024400 [Elysia marginata]